MEHLIATLKNLFHFWQVKLLFATVLAYLNGLFGYDWIVIEVFAYLVTIDWILGVCVAIKRKRFNSWKMKGYLYKFLLYLSLMIAIHQSVRIHYFPNWAHEIIELMICITELKSILENAAILGFKMAAKLDAKLNDYLDDKLK